MRHLILTLAGVAVMLMAGACKAETPPAALKTAPLSIVSRDGKTHDFKVELAVTEEEQVHGLMDRTSMPEGTGMLFVFDTVDYRSFWMKDTLIPLDMVFIGADGNIVNIHENAQPNDLTSILSNGPVKAVLELAGGSAAKLGIKPGDTVKNDLIAANGG